MLAHRFIAILSGWAALACQKGPSITGPQTAEPPEAVTASQPDASGSDVAGPSSEDVAVAGSKAAPKPAIRILAPTDPGELETDPCSGELVDGESVRLAATPDGKLSGLVSGPEGAVVTIGSGPALTLGKEPAPFAIDALALAVDNGPGTDDVLVTAVVVPVAWTLPDGKPGGRDLACDAADAVRHGLERVRKGPLRWPDEGEQRYRDDTLVVFDRFSGAVKLDGPYGVTLYDADFIAFESTSYRSFPPCRYDVVDTSTGQRTGPSVEKSRTAADLRVEIIDRRTGKLVKAKTYEAPTPDCPAELPSDAVVAEVTGANIDDIYQTVRKDRPEGAPDELPRPIPALTLPPDDPGTVIAERAPFSVATIAERFAALGVKNEGAKLEPRSQTSEGEDAFLTYGTQADGADVSIHAIDWARTRDHAHESTITTFIVKGRGALALKSSPGIARRLTPTLLRLSAPSPQGLADLVAGFGFTIDGELPTLDPEPGTDVWYAHFERKDEWFSVTVVDWSEVADGKVPQEAVARSKDAFVVIRSSVAGKAKAILDQLLP